MTYDTLTINAPSPDAASTDYTIASGEGRNDTFIVDSEMRLFRKPYGDPFTYQSRDASGAFRLTRVVDGGVVYSAIKFFNGVVVDICSEAAIYGYCFEPTWERIEHVADGGMHKCVTEHVGVIHRAQTGSQVDYADDKQRVMVALALCDSHLLGKTSAATGWALLDPEHIAAICSWAR